MSDDRKSSGGVRSLRAMFENNENTTPVDDRGRRESASGQSVGDRPTSKVRTSFVGVDQSGHLGRTLSRTDSQQRDQSRAVSERSQSIAEEAGIDHSPPQPRSTHHDTARRAPPIETVLSKVRNLSAGIRGSELSAGNTPASATKLDSPSRTMFSSEVEWTAAALPSGRRAEEVSPLATTIPPPANGQVTKSTEVAKPSANTAVSPQNQRKLKDGMAGQDAKGTSQSQAAEPTRKTDNIPSQGTSVAKVTREKPKFQDSASKPSDAAATTSQKSSFNGTKASSTNRDDATTATTSRTALQSKSVRSSLNAVDRAKARPRESTASLSSVTSATSTATAGGTRTIGGFVKPRPRSPTRPVKLPAHLTAATASSAAKHDGSAPGDPKPARKIQSQGSRPAAHHKCATDTKCRCGPLPPSQKRLSVAAVKQDDDFLARMMRPTASSSSKIAAQEEAPKTKYAAPDSSFLDRMMRPTASSSSKTKAKDEATAPAPVTLGTEKSLSGSQHKSADGKRKLPQQGTRITSHFENAAGAVKHGKLDTPEESLDRLVEKLTAKDAGTSAAAPGIADNVKESQPTTKAFGATGEGLSAEEVAGKMSVEPNAGEAKTAPSTDMPNDSIEASEVVASTNNDIVEPSDGNAKHSGSAEQATAVAESEQASA